MIEVHSEDRSSERVLPDVSVWERFWDEPDQGSSLDARLDIWREFGRMLEEGSKEPGGMRFSLPDEDAGRPYGRFSGRREHYGAKGSSSYPRDQAVQESRLKGKEKGRNFDKGGG